MRDGTDGRQARTRFSLGDDDPTALEDCFQLVEVEITVGGARSSACRYDGFFDGKLDDERLHDA